MGVSRRLGVAGYPYQHFTGRLTWQIEHDYRTAKTSVFQKHQQVYNTAPLLVKFQIGP